MHHVFLGGGRAAAAAAASEAVGKTRYSTSSKISKRRISRRHRRSRSLVPGHGKRLVFVVDTNILIHAVNANSPFHEPCAIFWKKTRSNHSAWYLTWPIIYEFLRLTTHEKVFQNRWSINQSLQFVQAVLSSPGLGMLSATERHAQVLTEIIREIPNLGGSIMHDAHTAVLMREHGINRIITRDKGFRRFPFIEAIDPVSIH